VIAKHLKKAAAAALPAIEPMDQTIDAFALDETIPSSPPFSHRSFAPADGRRRLTNARPAGCPGCRDHMCAWPPAVRR
jgi:hypothetical protein